MSRYIKNWEELKAIPNESDTHILKIDLEYDCGHLIAKKLQFKNYYLSTHTFYGSHYKGASKILRDCGFDVELANWDKE